MNCPYLKEDYLICTAETSAKERSHVPSRIEMIEFCRSDKYTLCYLYYMNKDALDKRS